MVCPRLEKQQRSDAQVTERLVSLGNHGCPMRTPPETSQDHHSTIVLGGGFKEGPYLSPHDAKIRLPLGQLVRLFRVWADCMTYGTA